MCVLLVHFRNQECTGHQWKNNWNGKKTLYNFSTNQHSPVCRCVTILKKGLHQRSTCTVPEFWEDYSMEEKTSHDPRNTASSVKHGRGGILPWSLVTAVARGMQIDTEKYSLLRFKQTHLNSLDNTTSCSRTMILKPTPKKKKEFIGPNLFELCLAF